jgi:hypothetical protein
MKAYKGGEWKEKNKEDREGEIKKHVKKMMERSK